MPLSIRISVCAALFSSSQRCAALLCALQTLQRVSHLHINVVGLDYVLESISSRSVHLPSQEWRIIVHSYSDSRILLVSLCHNSVESFFFLLKILLLLCSSCLPASSFIFAARKWYDDLLLSCRERGAREVWRWLGWRSDARKRSILVRTRMRSVQSHLISSQQNRATCCPNHVSTAH